MPTPVLLESVFRRRDGLVMKNFETHRTPCLHTVVHLFLLLTSTDRFG